MAAAGNGLDRIKNCAKSLEFIEKSVSGSLTEDEKALLEQADSFRVQLEKAMDDDFNTADAVTAIFELVRFANQNVSEKSSKEFVTGIKAKLLTLCSILGIDPIEKQAENEDTAKIESLIAQRTEAKKAKDFAKADAIRAELLEMGVVIEDTRAGVRWSYAK
jgi:cysteinyl-tRNA synthetase